MSFVPFRIANFSRRVFLTSQSRLMASQVSDLGSGAGKGGGGGGSIREAGGAFGRMEAAHEEEYFYKKQREQLKSLQKELHQEIDFHERQIQRHKEAIERHRDRVKKLEEDKGSSSGED